MSYFELDVVEEDEVEKGKRSLIKGVIQQCIVFWAGDDLSIRRLFWN